MSIVLIKLNIVPGLNNIVKAENMQTLVMKLFSSYAIPNSFNNVTLRALGTNKRHPQIYFLILEKCILIAPLKQESKGKGSFTICIKRHQPLKNRDFIQ